VRLFTVLSYIGSDGQKIPPFRDEILPDSIPGMRGRWLSLRREEDIETGYGPGSDRRPIVAFQVLRWKFYEVLRNYDLPWQSLPPMRSKTTSSGSVMKTFQSGPSRYMMHLFLSRDPAPEERDLGKF